MEENNNVKKIYKYVDEEKNKVTKNTQKVCISIIGMISISKIIVRLCWRKPQNMSRG